MTPEKQQKYFQLANYFAETFSKDTSTKVGAILLAPNTLQILSTGYNGMPEVLMKRVRSAGHVLKNICTLNTQNEMPSIMRVVMAHL